MNTFIIYKTTNLINNKIYVGQDSKNRPNYLGSGKLLKLAIKKYGKKNFRKEIVEECTSVKELDEREIYWIKKLKCTNKTLGYNICLGGRVNRNMGGKNHPMYGKHHSKYIREKISKNTRKGMTEEVKAIIKEKRKYQVFSEKTRILWSKRRGGKNNGMYGLRGKNSPNYGKTCSDETKRKISKANTGKNNGMYGMCGKKNPAATEYIIQTPDGSNIKILSKQNVMNILNCSLGFFCYKKFRGYKLLKSIKVNKNK